MGTIPKARFDDPLLKARAARRFALWRSAVLHPAAVLALAIVGVGAALWVHPLLGAGLVAVALVGIWVWADAKATGEWWLLLLDHLKMQPDDELVGQLTPLLRSGDEREVRRAATDGRRRLLIFRSTDVSRDSDGDKTESHHDYTLVVYHDAALYLQTRGLSQFVVGNDADAEHHKVGRNICAIGKMNRTDTAALADEFSDLCRHAEAHAMIAMHTECEPLP